MYFWGHGAMLVNAYLAYKRAAEKLGKKPMSHYEFRKAFVLAKICRAKYGPGKRRSTKLTKRQRTASSVRSEKELCTPVESAKVLAPYLNAVAVKKGSGGLCEQRLDMSRVHMPEPLETYEKHGKCCTLCRWATGKKLATMLSKCDTCGAHLCVWHFKLFHTVEDLQAVKGEIADEVEKRIGKRKPRKLFAKKKKD